MRTRRGADVSWEDAPAHHYQLEVLPPAPRFHFPSGCDIPRGVLEIPGSAPANSAAPVMTACRFPLLLAELQCLLRGGGLACPQGQTSLGLPRNHPGSTAQLPWVYRARARAQTRRGTCPHPLRARALTPLGHVPYTPWGTCPNRFRHVPQRFGARAIKG